MRIIAKLRTRRFAALVLLLIGAGILAIGLLPNNGPSELPVLRSTQYDADAEHLPLTTDTITFEELLPGGRAVKVKTTRDSRLVEDMASSVSSTVATVPASTECIMLGMNYIGDRAYLHCPQGAGWFFFTFNGPLNSTDIQCSQEEIPGGWISQTTQAEVGPYNVVEVPAKEVQENKTAIQSAVPGRADQLHVIRSKASENNHYTAIFGPDDMPLVLIRCRSSFDMRLYAKRAFAE